MDQAESGWPWVLDRRRWRAGGRRWAAVAPADEIDGPEYSIEEIAFIAADTDGDGVVTEAEMARDAARGFATLDKDGSGTLTPEELGPHDAGPVQAASTPTATACSASTR